MTSPVGASGASAIDQGPSRRIAIVVSLMPVWTLLALRVFGSSFLEPVFSNPPGILGLPFGVVLLAVSLVWTLFGVMIVARVRSAVARGAALSLFTIPAAVLVVLSPAVIAYIVGLP